MKKIAIIPARGGSKRIPRKNIKDFLGKPIITYSIEVALSSGLFDEVMVSTDDEEITTIAKEAGAAVPFLRSKEASDDHATTFAVIREVLDSYKMQGRTFDYVCCIYPTAPLLSVDSLNDAFNMLASKEYSCVFPVVAYSYPVLRSLNFEGDFIKMVWPENENKRSQDLPTFYHDAGQFYFFKPEPILQQKKLWVKNSGAVILTEECVQDIDNEVDWQLAELKFKLKLDSNE